MSSKSDGSKQAITHSIVLGPDLAEVASARRFVAGIATEAGFSDSRVFDITVASSEAIANAIEHAPIKGHVGVTTVLHPDRLEIQIEGPGEFQAPDRQKERSARGLGLPLMAKLSDHLALYSGPHGGTFVSLTFYRPGTSDEEDERGALPPSVRELIEENELISAIAENAPVGLYVLDPELRFRWANRAYREFLEEPYRSQPLEGVFIGDAVPGDGTARSAEIVRTVSCTGERAFFPEYEFIGFARGTTYWRWDVLPLKRERREPPFDVLVVINEITEQVRHRKSMEALADGLRRQQAEIETLLENTPAGLVLFEGAPPYKVLAHNRYYQELFDEPFRSRGMVGLNIYEYAPAVEAEGVAAVFDEVVRTKEPTSFLDFPYKSNPPLQSWFNWHMSPLVLDGEVVALVSMSLDVTDRHRVEEALRETEDRFRWVLDQSLDGLYRVNLKTGRYEYLSPAFGKIVGRSNEEFMRLSPEESMRLVHPEDLPNVQAALGEREVAPNAEIDYRLLGSDGEYRWVSNHFSQTTDDEGTALYRTGVVRDISDRRAAQEALRGSEEKYRSLFDSMTEGFVLGRAIYDENGTPIDHVFLEANDAFFGQTGIKKEVILNKPVTEAIPGIRDDPANWIEMYGRVAKTGEPFRFESYAQYEKKWYSLHVYSPLKDHFAVIFTDITARKQADRDRELLLSQQQELNEELAAANEELAAVNEELQVQTEELQRSYAEQEQYRRFDQALLDATSALHASLHSEDVLERALSLGAQALGADAAALDTWDSDGFRVSRVYGVSHKQVGEFIPAALAIHGEQALRNNETVALDDTRGIAVRGGLVGEHGIRSLIVAPCFRRGEPVGALYVNFIAAPHTFTDAEKKFVGHLASAFSLAMENALLYEGQKSLLDRLQSAFLELPESVPGIEYGHEYRSATTGALVGGDFYDVYRVPDGRLALVVGDVSGHGLESARNASIVKDSFNLLLMQGGRPGGVLSQTNRFLIDRLLPGFVTAFLGLLDLSTGELIFASAGHPDPFVASERGQVRSVDAVHSSPLGTFPDASFTEGRTGLQRGDVLVLYTDGVTDARRDGVLFGEGGLVESLARYKGLQVSDLAHNLVHDALVFADGRLHDDAAVLAVRFGG